jgi:antitoxin component of MazEF toxin-antitoxin module
MKQCRKVIKTGNSLAVTIPSKAIRDFDIKEGDLATIHIHPPQSALKIIFSGHPRQLSLIEKKRA